MKRLELTAIFHNIISFFREKIIKEKNSPFGSSCLKIIKFIDFGK